jgi:hypothetical protein
MSWAICDPVTPAFLTRTRIAVPVDVVAVTLPSKPPNLGASNFVPVLLLLLKCIEKRFALTHLIYRWFLVDGWPHQIACNTMIINSHMVTRAERYAYMHPFNGYVSADPHATIP